MSNMDELEVDPMREKQMPYINTGIYVRAKRNGKWGSHDIAHLSKASLLVWLNSYNDNGRAAKNAVGILLGHGHLTNSGEKE